MSFWESLWNIIVVFFWAFVFVAALFALFMILTDLFRDRELKGWKKAIWIVALIFLPILTALIYIIARGDGMAKRSAKEAREAQNATEQYIRSVATTSPTEEISKAKALLDSGAISADEFNSIKRQILQSPSGLPEPAAPAYPNGTHAGNQG